MIRKEERPEFLVEDLLAHDGWGARLVCLFHLIFSPRQYSSTPLQLVLFQSTTQIESILCRPLKDYSNYTMIDIFKSLTIKYHKNMCNNNKGLCLGILIKILN